MDPAGKVGIILLLSDAAILKRRERRGLALTIKRYLYDLQLHVDAQLMMLKNLLLPSKSSNRQKSG